MANDEMPETGLTEDALSWLNAEMDRYMAAGDGVAQVVEHAIKLAKSAAAALEEVERLRERVGYMEGTSARDEILLWEAYHQMKACDHYCALGAAMRDVTAALLSTTSTDTGEADGE